MPGETAPNLVTLFFDRVERFGDRPFLWAKRDGAYRPLSWHRVAAQVSGLARGLKGLGLEKGDRVVLASENRPEWLIADLAIMAAGGITVPAYATNTQADHRHVIENSAAKGAILSGGRIAERFLPAADAAPDMKFAVTMGEIHAPGLKSLDIHDWSAVLEPGSKGHENIVEEARKLRRDETACIIYTSGTGGEPKGVMLHHGAILHNCAGAREAVEELGLDREVFLSFLPLSHSYEHTSGQFFPLYLGAEIYYADGVETLATNLIEARPTVMTAVPRLYETFHRRILRAVAKTGGMKEKLFMKALDLGLKRLDGKRLGPIEGLMDAVLEKLVRDKIRARFGGRLKAMISGGAPLNPEIGAFFTALGLRILQGYGQTESAPVISVNRPTAPKIGTVGPPLPDTEVEIAKDGEILVRGELVMKGYWRNPAATDEVIRDGWLHTGDIGKFDADGHLLITDRKKDIIVNSGGDNISPQRIEGLLAMEPEIAQVMVYGDRRAHLVALIAPDEDWLKNWASGHGKAPGPNPLADLAEDDGLVRALGRAVERGNEKLSNIEKVRRFTVAREPFTIDNGLLTPTLKIRRYKILEIYRETLDGLYA